MKPATLDLAPYRAAIRERICAFCIDHAGLDHCGRGKDDPCALLEHLDLIVPAILGTRRSPDVGDYVKALRDRVCPRCRDDLSRSCPLRSLAACPADSYLLPVIEVIEEVAARGRRA